MKFVCAEAFYGAFSTVSAGVLRGIHLIQPFTSIFIAVYNLQRCAQLKAFLNFEI